MYDLHNAFSRTHVRSPSTWLPEGVPSSVPSTYVASPSTRVSSNSGATPVPALLVVDGGHLHQALHEVVGTLAEDKDRTGLVSGLLDEMERALGVRFIKKVLHEATLGAQPTPLASALSSLASPFLVKTRPLKVKAGAPIDPTTLEPLPDGGSGPLAMLVEAGIDVAMALDVLRHASLGRDKSPYGAIVVATGNGDLGEVLDLASQSTTVYVCGMRDSTAHLQHLVPRGVSLDGLLTAALDLYCARRRDHPVSGEKLKRVCSLGNRCTNLHDPSHLMSHVHPCPMRSACEYLRPSPVQEEDGEDAAARDRLEHLMHFSHPCPHADHCTKSLQQHRIMWSHPASSEADHKQAATEAVRTQQPEDPASPGSPHLMVDPFGATEVGGGYSSMPVAERSAAAVHHNQQSTRSSSSSARPRLPEQTQLSGVRFNRHHEEAAGDEDRGHYLDSRWGDRAKAARQSRCIPQTVLHPALLGARHRAQDWEEGAALREEEQDDLLDVFRFAFHGFTTQQRESNEGKERWSEQEEDDGDEQGHGDTGDASLPDPACMFSMSL